MMCVCPGRRPGLLFALVAAACLYAAPVRAQDAFRFRTGVDLVNVTATVTDASGRFVAGLSKADFAVFEDDRPIDITHFSAERVPVSLGIVLDTSGSMDGLKLEAARVALERFLVDLLGPEDEVFLYRFDNAPHLVEGWTTDRQRIRDDLRALRADGATALYDAIAAALPLLESGRHRKKALLVISDGNDTSSRTGFAALKGAIRESEALVYAIGIDAQSRLSIGSGEIRRQTVRFGQRRLPFPRPTPFPRRPEPPRSPPIPGTPPGTAPTPPRVPSSEPSSSGASRTDEPVNASALRAITDDSGGRTEIIHDTADLVGTTARIGDELSKQYYLGCPSSAARDGQWHALRVEVRDRSMRVRARRGYVATP
jgi:VWFA-related protein